jgi:hypothetical protein
MKPTRIGPLFMISIMVLATVGVSYAHWEETLYVSGIMYTDDIHPFFRNPISNDPCVEPELWLDPWEWGEWPYPSVNPDDWIGDRKNKDVGCTEIIIQPDSEDTELGITVWDAYPCYFSHVYWEIVNDGSVPVNLVSYKLVNLSLVVDLDGDQDPDVDIVIPKNRDLVIGTEYYIKWNDAGDSVWIHEGVPNNPDNFDFAIMPTGDFALGDQLDPNYWENDGLPHFAPGTDGHYVFHADLGIHFLNGCWQNATYDFDLEMVFYNWPELCDVGELPFHNADLMLVLDKSGSIDATEFAALQTAANAFITAIHMDDAITGQTSFETTADMDLHLTSSEAAAHTAINTLSPTSGNTNLYQGMLLAYDELILGTYDASNDPGSSVGDRIPDGDYPDYMVVITDGAPNEPGSYPAPYNLAWGVANDSDAHGIEIFVVGVGLAAGSPNEDFLKYDIATTENHYFGIADYDDLEDLLILLVTGP